MKTLDVKTNYRTYKECFLRVERYWHDGSISLTIWNQNDGCLGDKFIVSDRLLQAVF